MKKFWSITIASLLLAVGVYVFRFPNGFSFGGVSGLAVVLAKIMPLSAATLNLVINILLLVVGIVFLGKNFATRSVYATVLFTLAISVMEKLFPMDAPLTQEPMLELIFAIALPAVASAVLFHYDACSGGTDVVALLLQKYSKVPIGTALLFADSLIAASAFFVYGVETGLYSMVGLLAKSLVIDDVIESIRTSKYFTVVCRNPKPIVKYITEDLDCGATIYKAEGAYTHEEKTVILTAMRRPKASKLRDFIRKTEPDAFMMIAKTSEIVGKGFLE